MSARCLWPLAAPSPVHHRTIIAPPHRRLAPGAGPAARQRGAVIITTALLLLFLLGFMGIAVDFGRLFAIKSEMQTAMDSCALAAAQELDGGTNITATVTRATSAGTKAGNLNKIQFQGDIAGLLEADVTFSDSLSGTYSRAPSVPPKYAKCEHLRAGLTPWLLQALSGFTGDPKYKVSNGVFALGVATLSSAQTACAIPVRIRPKTSTPPNFGYTKGDWIPSIDKSSGTQGHFGWANLNPELPSSASTLGDQLRGSGACIKTDSAIADTGVKFSAAEEWNSRFGLYTGGGGSHATISNAPPDLTGYGYYPNPKDSNNVTLATGTKAPLDLMSPHLDVLSYFDTARASNLSYGGTVDSVNAGDAITGLKMKGGYGDSDMATHAAGTRALATHGASRRLVLAPIMSDTSGKVDGWACVLMLHPIADPNSTVYLEYIDNARAPSRCAATGLAGGTNGPQVPVLVQ